jgi:2-dehydro-3-deoxygalactonokinase
MLDRPFVAIDSGTSNTRVWFVRGGEVVARASSPVGVRDTARDGSTDALSAGLADAIGRAATLAGEPVPALGLAAGMITSNLGLIELPHLRAPCGVDELAGAMVRMRFGPLPPLTIWFVRGVRTGDPRPPIDAVPDADIIRGEETEIVGALAALSLNGPLLYVHLGSHTKAICVDEHGRIAGGITTLSGELERAVREQTILAGTVEPQQDGGCDLDFAERGAAWSARYGLSRALFLVRILEQSGGHDAGRLGSVVVGATAAADVQAMRGHGLLGDATGTESPRVVLSGRPTVQAVWQRLLEREGCAITALNADDTERAFLAGLQQVASRSAVCRNRG